MGENSGIGWTDATFNPVWGCTKVSPGCDGCYAEAWDRRVGGDHWGPGKPRREFGDKHWNDPIRWNRKAEKDGKRIKVFCSSMGDVFDNEWPDGTRERLWRLIADTPHLDWLLLTKRIGNAQKMAVDHWGLLPRNIWLGASIVNQEEADRDIPKLLKVPARIRWLSVEPQLERIHLLTKHLIRLDWIVCGGESSQGKHQARPFNLSWARDLRDQCRTAGIWFFMKQMGAHAQDTDRGGYAYDPIRFRDRAGADPAEWPADLRVQEWPQ